MVFREVLKMQKTEERIHVVDAPDIPGLTFRHFRGEVDYPAMVAVIQDSKDADGNEHVETVEEIARYYAHLKNCDPYRDMIFAEMNGKVIGYGRVWWAQEANGEKPYIYRLIGWVLPEWRGRGIGTAMRRWQEARLREVGPRQGRGDARLHESWAAGAEEGGPE